VKKKIINEALGVPSEINMLTDIFSDMILEKISAFKNSNEELETKLIDTKVREDVEVLVGSFRISKDESWDYVKNSPKFNPKEWEKFPMYKNPVLVSFDIIPDDAIPESDNHRVPLINASHQFEAKEFKVKSHESLGRVYDISIYEFKIFMKQSNWDNLETLNPKLESTITHEIFHAFQLYTKYIKANKVGFGKENVYNTAVNALQQEFSPDFNRFLHILYLSLRFEHQARIPQALRILKQQQVSNYPEFIQAIKKTDAWDDIQNLKSFSADNLIHNINKMESFEDLLFKGPQRSYVPQRILEWDEILDKIVEFSKQNGLSVEPIRKMNKRTLENPELFFKYWEKFFHKRGDELFKKIARLYGMI